LRAEITGVFIVAQANLEKETRIMSLTHWLSERLGLSRRPASQRPCPARSTFRPRLETLEDRWCPSTLTVSSIADSGANSLRADIAAAHNGDTIAFAPNLDGQTITLTKGELLLNKNLTITGFSDHGLTVSGNNHSRVFEVATGSQVNLSGLTISKGQAVNGGGILVDTGAVLAVNNSTLSGNSASTSKMYTGNFGGGIDNYGTATVSNSTLTDNSALAGGGGIYNHATLTVNNNSVVSGNIEGGIANTGNAAVSDSILSNNSGSGIANLYPGTLYVSNCFLTDNSAFGNGGGIYNMGMATISNCTLTGNSAPEYGGGIYGGSNSGGSGKLTVIGCTLSDNFAEGDIYSHGGGIAVISSTATISNCTLSGNSATYGGGGIYVYGGIHATVTVSDSIFSMNTPDNILGAYTDDGGNSFS